MSRESFWQCCLRFPIDLQFEVWRAQGHEVLAMCALPTPVSDTFVARPVPGVLMAPARDLPYPCMMCLTVGVLQAVAVCLALEDLVTFSCACRRVNDCVHDCDTWSLQERVYLQNLPGRVLFSSRSLYRLHPAPHVTLRSSALMVGEACVLLSRHCLLSSIIIGVTKAASADVRCCCTVRLPFQDSTTVCAQMCPHSETPATMSCPFLMRSRHLHVFRVAWTSSTFLLEIDGVAARKAHMRALADMTEAFVSVCCIGPAVASDTVQLAFAVRHQHAGDLAGGALKEIHETGVKLTMASLPHAIHTHVISMSANVQTVVRFRSCSRSWRTVFQDHNVLQNATVDLRNAKPRAFRPGSAFVELLPAFAKADTVRVAYQHTVAVPLNASARVMVDWSGRHFTQPNMDFRSWRSSHPVYQQASFDVAASSEITVLVLGVKTLIQNSPPQTRAAATLHQPFSGHPLLALPEAPDFLAPANVPRHTGVRWINVMMQWDDTLLQVFVDDEKLCDIDVAAAGRVLNSWAYPYVVSVAQPAVPPLVVVTEPFCRPLNVPNPGCVLCAGARNMRTADACCLDCQQWFCSEHGFPTVQTCYGCVDDAFWQDAVGAASSHGMSAEFSRADAAVLLEERRLQALRKQQLAIPADSDKARKIADKIFQTAQIFQNTLFKSRLLN